MERSEMITLISGLIRNSKAGSYAKRAEEILNFIEECGMLPPRHKDYEDSLDKCPRGYEWEPEDE